MARVVRKLSTALLLSLVACSHGHGATREERAAEVGESPAQGKGRGSGQRAILAFPMPPVPEKKSKLQTAIENARKPDCRTAYQGLGLAAIVPLIANEFGEGSCRW